MGRAEVEAAMQVQADAYQAHDQNAIQAANDALAAATASFNADNTIQEMTQ